LRKYEVMFILDPREELDLLKNSLKELFKENGAEILEEKEMGLRKLAYPIKKRDKGFYYLLNLKSEPSKNEFLKKELNLKEPVMRYIFVNQEK